MAATGRQANVYDEKGTILFRAVPSPQSTVEECESTAPPPPPSITVASSVSSAHVAGKREGKSRALVPSGGSLTAAHALSILFPPEALPPAAEAPPVEECVWVKVAAVDHTGRMDAVHLQDHLRRRCGEENARPTGVLCTIREGIYTDGLREVIRQVTVLCPERGLLLAELAAEMRQTTNTYDTLFDSACQYAVRKGIERDMQSSLFDEKEQLESEVRRLENRVNELRAKHDGLLKRFEEQEEGEKKMHEEEVKYLKKANQQIVNEIKRITALEKANLTGQNTGKTMS